MSREKQIEEMAKDLQKSEHWYFDEKSVEFELDRQKTAENLYNTGYLKQSEGYWYFTEYEYYTCSVCGKSHFNFCDSTAEARAKLENGEYYPYCPECGAKMKGV